MPFVLRHTEIRIQAGKAWLDALLAQSPDVRGLVIYALPYLARLREARETHFCKVLEDAGFGTLLLSLLTPYEDSRDPDVRYNIALISQRLLAVTTWISQQPELGVLPLGIVASSTVAAGAIRLAGQDEQPFSALVSKAGRIDLAGAAPLRKLCTPILVLLPGAEPDLPAATASAYALLEKEKDLFEFPNVSAGFFEPGSLDKAAHIACKWLTTYMPEPPPPRTETAPFCE